MLANYSLADLAAVRRFVEDALDLQQRMTATLVERQRKGFRK
jgi:hypothetical protein